MHADPVIDAARHFDALYAAQDAQERSEEEMRDSFLAYVKAGDVKAAPSFAGQSSDFTKHPDGTTSWVPRPAHLWECMRDACDYDTPELAAVMQVLVNAANGQDMQREAADLIRQMAATYAAHNAEASDE